MTEYEIDIDECLRAIEVDPTITVMFGPSQGVVIRVEPRKQLSLMQRYINPRLQIDSKTLDRIVKAQAAKGKPLEESDVDDFDGSFQMGGSEDYYGFGVALTDFVDGWKGFRGKLDRPKLKKWLEMFPDYAAALGRNFRGYLTEYQRQHERRSEALEKN